MLDEMEQPAPKPLGLNEKMSIAELEDFIAEAAAQIKVAEQMIASKRAAADAANAFFKS